MKGDSNDGNQSATLCFTHQCFSRTVRLSVGWYLGYDLNEPLSDHSSLTRIRERYGVDIFRRFFDAIVEQCQQENSSCLQREYTHRNGC